MKRSGSAIIMVTTIVSLILLTALLVSANAVSNMNITTEEKTRNRLTFACESGIKRAKAKIEESFNNGNLTLLEPDIYFLCTDEDDTGETPEDKAYPDETFNAGINDEPDYYKFIYHSAEDNKDIIVKYAITEDEDDAIDGWKKFQSYTSYKVKIHAIAYAPGYGWVGMTQRTMAKRTTLFMYQIFFMDDLEILPGPTFNLKGLIHTNSNLYLNSNNSLNVYTDSITAAGEAFRGRLDRDEVTGSVKISKGDENGSLVDMGSSDDSDNNNWINIATSKWQGTLRDKSLGATRLEAPKLQSFEPGGYYDQNAGIKIQTIPGTTTTYKISYNNKVETYTSAQLNYALTETTVYDYREYPSGTKPANNIPVKITNVDINKLKTKLNYYPTNGLIYMTRGDAVADKDGNDYTADANRKITGFKLVNGSSLPGPTTFISNLPVYVQGDYNKHTSDDPNTDKWWPSAIVADAITILSNSWSDAKSNWKDPNVVPSKTMPKAYSGGAQVNSVFIAGNTKTKFGQYNGGLENFPRFLEDWTDVNLNILGGFIQLYRSKYSTGIWNGTYYKAPNRNWSSEERFADLRDLPPGFSDLFPSTNIGMFYSNWQQVSKDEIDLREDTE